MSAINLDLLNDSELQRMSEVLALRRSIRALREQIVVYDANNARRKAALEAEITVLESKIATALDSGERRGVTS